MTQRNPRLRWWGTKLSENSVISEEMKINGNTWTRKWRNYTYLSNQSCKVGKRFWVPKTKAVSNRLKLQGQSWHQRKEVLSHVQSVLKRERRPARERVTSCWYSSSSSWILPWETEGCGLDQRSPNHVLQHLRRVHRCIRVVAWIRTQGSLSTRDASLDLDHLEEFRFYLSLTGFGLGSFVCLI